MLPSFPAIFSTTPAFSAPLHAKKKKEKRKNFLILVQMIGGGGKCETSHIPTRYNKWARPRGSKGNKPGFGGGLAPPGKEDFIF